MYTNIRAYVSHIDLSAFFQIQQMERRMVISLKIVGTLIPARLVYILQNFDSRD